CTLPLRFFYAFPTRRSSDLIKATSGNIKAGLHASMDDYTLEGKASSGNVVVDLPLSFDMQRENVVKGSTGNGDKYIILQTHSGRSEEHTSELQSRFDLVCRL